MSRRIISLVLSLGLLFQQTSFAQIATELNIAGYLSRAGSSFAVDKFRPTHLRYFSYDSLNDNFKILLDKGDLKNLKASELENSTKTLLSYFLIGVTLPDSMFWVNLRPDSEDQIIDQYLEKTDIGKILLEADLQLKKDTAAMTSPATPEGKEYWDKLYKKAADLYGYDNVTIPTLTRPWIVPGEIIVRESKDSAYVYKATLKVMLEQDYLKNSSTYNFQDTRSKALNEYSSQLIRELIIPKLTKEVNSSKRYAPLRQVYYSLILSRWFKLRFTGKTGTYASLINAKDLTNLISKESWSKTEYFNQYKKSFQAGEYNIKEPVYTPTGQIIRSYFSGGINVASSAINTQNGMILANDNAVKLGEVVGGRAVVDPQNISLKLDISSSPVSNVTQKGVIHSDVGYFDEAANEYVVTNPNAPEYSMLMGLTFDPKNAIHGLVTSEGAGLTWAYEDPNDGRITRYVHGGSEQMLFGGRPVYIKDNYSGKIWSATPRPVVSTEFDSFECRIGIGYVKIVSQVNGIKVEQKIFIPVGTGKPEIHSISVENISSQPRDISVVVMREFPSAATPEQEAKNPQNSNYTNHIITSRVGNIAIVQSRTFYDRNAVKNEEGKDKAINFVAASRQPSAIMTDIAEFMNGKRGKGSKEAPRWIIDSDSQSLEESRGGYGCAALRYDFNGLASGEKERVNLIISAATDTRDNAGQVVKNAETKIEKIAGEYLGSNSDQTIKNRADYLKRYTRKLISNLKSSLPAEDKALELMVNTWWPAQTLLNYIFSRTVALFAGGQSRGLGARDSWQDAAALPEFPDKEAARQRIIDLMSALHLEAGDSHHGYIPRTKKAIEGAGFSDDHLWMVWAIIRYVKETGDYGLLDERVAYADNPDKKDTVLEHMVNALNFSYTHLGPHGIPLLLRADWDDSKQREYKGEFSRGWNVKNIKSVNTLSYAESVMNAGMLVRFAKDLAEAVREIKKEDVETAQHLDKIATEVGNNIQKYFWSEEDGYYAAGSDDTGNIYGTSKDQEGKMWLHPQTWALLAGIPNVAQKARIIENMDKKLLKKRGLFLMEVPYDETNPAVGSTNYYLAYFKENGLFNHAAAMAHLALLEVGYGDFAYKVLNANLSPLIHQENPWEYRREPYASPQVVNGENGEYGGGGDLLTGTAAWYFLSTHQYMLGVRPELDGLVIDPCIPKRWGKFSVDRVFRKSKLHITVDNSTGLEKGVKNITVRDSIGNISIYNGNLIPLAALKEGQNYEVTVIMGASSPVENKDLNALLVQMEKSYDLLEDSINKRIEEARDSVFSWHYEDAAVERVLPEIEKDRKDFYELEEKQILGLIEANTKINPNNLYSLVEILLKNLFRGNRGYISINVAISNILEGMAKTKHDVALLIMLLEGTNASRIHWYAAETLGEMGQEAEAALPALKKMASSEIDVSRKIAEKAIAKITSSSLSNSSVQTSETGSSSVIQENKDKVGSSSPLGMRVEISRAYGICASYRSRGKGDYSREFADHSRYNSYFRINLATNEVWELTYEEYLQHSNPYEDGIKIADSYNRLGTKTDRPTATQIINSYARRDKGTMREPFVDHTRGGSYFRIEPIEGRVWILTSQEYYKSTLPRYEDGIITSSSPVSQAVPINPGGIDFRALPMTIQPMGSFSGLNFKLPQLSQAELRQINVNSEMQQIKNMIRSGIAPSGQRIKELVAACIQKKEMDSQAKSLLLCLADVFKLEEENASESSPELREALVIVDSQS
jgi:cellobiose phosphorylase